MGDADDDEDDEFIVVDVIQDAVVADAKTVRSLFAFDFRCADGSGVGGEVVNCRCNAALPADASELCQPKV